MKTLLKLLGVFVLILFMQTASAQKSRSERQAAKAEALKKMVDNGTYTFEANFVNPQRGGGHQLTSTYDLRVAKDTVVAFLPYFGEAHVAPIDPTEGGIKFTSTSFNYTSKQHKNGGWEIVIKPKEKNIADMKDVQLMRLDISSNGYASLQVISTNRDPISFQGEIKGLN